MYLSLLTGSALGISIVTQSFLGGMLLLIVSVLLPWMLALAPAIAWLILQNVFLAVALSRIPEVSLNEVSTSAGFFLGISIFAFMSSVVVLRQNAARDELRKVNSELQATQSLLAENTRIAERVRIARELHDLVGHHLTALTLNLEVVTHLVDGKVLEHVQQAHSLAGCCWQMFARWLVICVAMIWSTLLMLCIPLSRVFPNRGYIWTCHLRRL